VTGFRAVFARAPDAEATAPGRVNLIGEHTDYNGGYVLPLALPLRTHAGIALRTDGRVRAFSATLPSDQGLAEYRRGAEQRAGAWIDYVQGVTQAMDRRALAVPGFDLFVRSTVPAGAGLASSAALEVAVVRALRTACALAIDDLEAARIAHEAETGLVGAPVGIMDQMAASLGDDAAALFLDTRTLAYERVALPPAGEVAIIDSGITHRHASGEYRRRRAECDDAAARLGVAQLRDLTPADLARVAALPRPLDRRARHVVTENARVLDAVDAMRAHDLPRLGRCFVASHESLRRDYEVTVPEIDTLVELAVAGPGVHGARMTGGGFGGAVLLLCDAGAAAGVAHSVLAAYHSRTVRRGRVLLPFRDAAGMTIETHQAQR
jgi:galactokinase